MKISSILIVILILACGAFGQRNKGLTVELKPFDATANWQYPYNAPTEKTQKLRAAAQEMKTPIDVAELFGRLGKPDLIEAYTGHLSHSHYLLSWVNSDKYSFVCLWFAKRSEKYYPAHEGYLAAYVDKDRKTVSYLKQWNLPDGQGSGRGVGQGSGRSNGSGIGTGSGSGSGRAARPAIPQSHPESYYLDTFGLGWENVFVRDEKNNYAGQAGGFIVNQISHLTYDPGENQVSMVLSTNGHTYTVGFIARSTPFKIRITRGVGNGYNANKEAVTFMDVSLPKGTMAKLIISAQRIGPNLLYDANGDRTFESSIAPTVNISGPTAKDITSPRIVIEITNLGRFANVSIGVTDDLSGVRQTRYSLDGVHFKVYSGPFSIRYAPQP